MVVRSVSVVTSSSMVVRYSNLRQEREKRKQGRRRVNSWTGGVLHRRRWIARRILLGIEDVLCCVSVSGEEGEAYPQRVAQTPISGRSEPEHCAKTSGAGARSASPLC
jgi:hypothetical protein